MFSLPLNFPTLYLLPCLSLILTFSPKHPIVLLCSCRQIQYKCQSNSIPYPDSRVCICTYVAFLHLSVCSPPVSSLAFNINNIFYFPQYSLFVAYTYVSRSSSHNTVLIFRDTRELVLSRPPIILQSLVSESPLCGKSMNGILWIVEVGWLFSFKFYFINWDFNIITILY